jgi:hypothetical protein
VGENCASELVMVGVSAVVASAARERPLAKFWEDEEIGRARGAAFSTGRRLGGSDAVGLSRGVDASEDVDVQGVSRPGVAITE